GLIHIGERKARAGRMGESGAEGITSALTLRGLVCGRLKTGTPPRVVKNSIDWSVTSPVSGDKFPTPFSYNTQIFSPPNITCHTTKTGYECKQIISENLHSSPLYSGDVLGVGPRYCPSIEDKIKRFSHHQSHLLFLEPEWIGSDQIYVNGFSTSLPQDVQLNALRTVKGLENVKFFRPGYAIEYDFFPPSQLKASLESKYFSNLFFAGQINGTSGYEEAAGQGLLAGVNAVQKINNEKPFILSRGEAYLGVLINDLITKDTLEPYRMFTSRAEYRLILRFTNANRRLADKSLCLKLINSEEYDKIVQNISLSAQILSALQQSIKPEEVNPTLVLRGEKPILTRRPAAQLLKRPALKISDLPVRLFKGIKTPDSNPFTAEAYAEAETSIKYEGYIRRQQETIERLNKQENVNIPDSFDYISINSLSNEAREKLSFVKPENLGQAMRVSGVTPADISVLSVLLHKQI
ncbi:MAG: tRNA uridine-5-carboxymethylaminomethyl(34) synthesis enzyme MnmG, partial [Candidatus Neomarinimicrobiota bacterium]